MAKITRWYFGPSGGSGGSIHIDPAKDLEKPVPKQFNVNSGWYIDRVEVRVADIAKSKSHLYSSSFGGHDGTKVGFTLDDGEYITEVFGTYEKFLVTLGIRTLSTTRRPIARLHPLESALPEGLMNLIVYSQSHLGSQIKNSIHSNQT